MEKFSCAVILLTLLTEGCASMPSQKDHVILGLGSGAALGAVGGATLSPDDQNRGLNTLIFGLSGALVGGLIGFFTASSPETPKGTPTLEEKEKAGLNPTKEYVVSPRDELPDFLKNRMSPAVIEEFIETDQVGEDGSLHAPHKVYRIKHATELLAKPETKKDSGTD